MDNITKLSVTIAKQLKHLRKNRKITQEQVVSDIGEHNISLRSYKTYESGDGTIPTLDRLVILCNYFNCSLDYLVFGVNTTKDDSFTLKDNLIRLTRLINCMMLQPVKETDINSEYFGKYYFISFDNSTQVFLDKLTIKCKEINDKFEYWAEDSFITLKDYDEVIQTMNGLEKDLSLTKDRMFALMKEANIDTQEYAETTIKRIKRRREVAKLNK